MDAAAIASLIGAAGGGAILLELTKRGLDKISNRGAKRRDEVDRAWRRVDREASKRRRMEEHASHLTRLLFAAPCVEPADIPSFPAYTDSDSRSNDTKDS
ncbi:hypothetical protein GCM10010915_11700 [Microbacterium faecale]|uniref:Uncharacterized protein n=1 Tax=Microbacterium faecale TaxID=1804630 RepID=A0A917DFA9_9MICO|nr:hypothetical protein [Microbacterium faecale]GGD32977.1 hypothetical protein GCM10010915_11700 [Microbacterium faecale]